MKKTVLDTIDGLSSRFREIALYIGSHPELGHQEYEASKKLTEELSVHGFNVERGLLDMETSFLATYDSGKPGPVVAFLCEYDALPGLGHACGHHIIGTASLAAAVGLKSVIDEIGGVIRVYGTPAEETNGAKVPMAAAGLFDDVDVAMMAHPARTYRKSRTFLAMDNIQFDYYGKPSHAAAAPHLGVNALDAVIQLFNSINALHLQLQSDARIHGIITRGGEAANIITAHATAQFSIRSRTRAYTDEMVQKVLRCAEGAALQTGCRLETSNYEYSYDELRTNETLSEVFTQNLYTLGAKEEEFEVVTSHGSSDIGNVSLRCPSIHPYIKVMEEPYQHHTEEFRDGCMKERAMEGMLIGAKALAGAAYDVIVSQDLLRGIKEEFAAGPTGGVYVMKL